MELALDDVRRVYDALKADSRKHIDHREWSLALKAIEEAARTAYLFNWIYTDPELEAQLHGISRAAVQPTAFVPEQGRVVFYDSWGLDNRGLTLQYLRALQAMDVQLLYIFENEQPDLSASIRSELAKSSNCQVFSVNRNLSTLERIDAVRRQLEVFRPEKLLTHITPWAAEAVTLLYALPQVRRYQINLTDHAFWLGVGCVDYCFEFRDYGCTVSFERRNIEREKLLPNPFYPLVASMPFQGFPLEARDRVVIFSGASFYKIYGRDGAFFRIAARLLAENPEAIILFAGGGEGREITDFIHRNSLEDRFILIGNRRDIGEVFAHCDIYLSTYPVTGGLMSQLAAVNGKPILAYTSPDIQCNMVEGIVCQKQTLPITIFDEQEFFKEARKLVTDRDYRRARGAQVRDGMITEQEFNESFANLFTSGQGKSDFAQIEIDYDAFAHLYLEIENKFQSPFKRLFLKNFRASAMWRFPDIFVKISPLLIEILSKRISMTVASRA
jgi:hypothetical protein